MIKVVGVGNPLLGDDGFGLKVIEFLKNKNIDNVDLIELPTPSPWDLYEVFRDGGFFIIVDVLASSNDNEVEVFPLSELKSYPLVLKSLHEVSIAQVLDLLKLNDVQIDGFVVGVKYNVIKPSITLSDNLAKLIPKTAKIVENLVKEIVAI
jgi:hydrogenase maturation protease